jgi:hypothetical protein
MFPADGQLHCHSILPLSPDDMAPAFTFLGSKDQWRIKQQKFAKLFTVNIDMIYRYLEVLTQVNEHMRGMTVDSSLERKNALAGLPEYIERNMILTNDPSITGVHDLGNRSSTYQQFEEEPNATDEDTPCDGNDEPITLKCSAVFSESAEVNSGQNKAINAMFDAMHPRFGSDMDVDGCGDNGRSGDEVEEEEDEDTETDNDEDMSQVSNEERLNVDIFTQKAHFIFGYNIYGYN